jgi:hypothetical protein
MLLCLHVKATDFSQESFRIEDLVEVVAAASDDPHDLKR